MNTEEAIIETLRTLPPDKQQEVLDFAEFLRQKTEATKLSEKSLSHEFDESNNTDLNKFKRLVAVWRTEQDPFSSILNFDHPAYQSIIEMGMPAVPFILKELQEDPDYWFWALQEITKENPILPEHEGNLDNMITDWLTWGKEKGYINK